MSKSRKNYRAPAEKFDRSKKYAVSEALKLFVDNPFAKFDETIDVAVNLGVDAKQSDQQVRSAVVLPNGVGKSARICVFAKGEKAKEAEAAGADFVGAEDLVEKINGGWLDFDKAIATPDMMPVIARVAKVLGPKGLMPNPKLGTVTVDLSKAIGEQKKGKIEFRTEKAGILHCSIGKRSFGADKLKENFDAFLGAVIRLKPQKSKGVYLRKISITSTMGPSLSVDATEAAKGI